MIIAGDFNAKSREWGLKWADKHGKEVLAMIASLDLTVTNTGCTTTFRRRGYREAILDITLATAGIHKRIKEWKVLEVYTASDHQFIVFWTEEKTITKTVWESSEKHEGMESQKNYAGRTQQTDLTKRRTVHI